MVQAGILNQKSVLNQKSDTTRGSGNLMEGRNPPPQTMASYPKVASSKQKGSGGEEEMESPTAARQLRDSIIAKTKAARRKSRHSWKPSHRHPHRR